MENIFFDAEVLSSLNVALLIFMGAFVIIFAIVIYKFLEIGFKKLKETKWRVTKVKCGAIEVETTDKPNKKQSLPIQSDFLNSYTECIAQICLDYHKRIVALEEEYKDKKDFFKEYQTKRALDTLALNYTLKDQQDKLLLEELFKLYLEKEFTNGILRIISLIEMEDNYMNYSELQTIDAISELTKGFLVSLKSTVGSQTFIDQKAFIECLDETAIKTCIEQIIINYRKFKLEIQLNITKEQKDKMERIKAECARHLKKDPTKMTLGV